MSYSDIQKMINELWNQLCQLEKQYLFANENRKKSLEEENDDDVAFNNMRCLFLSKKILEIHKSMGPLIEHKKKLYYCDFILCPDAHDHEKKESNLVHL